MTNDVQHPFIWLLNICISSFVTGVITWIFIMELYEFIQFRYTNSSCPNSSPFAVLHPSHPPIPTVNSHTVVHVRGSFIHVLCLVPSPSSHHCPPLSSPLVTFSLFHVFAFLIYPLKHAKLFNFNEIQLFFSVAYDLGVVPKKLCLRQGHRDLLQYFLLRVLLYYLLITTLS